MARARSLRARRYHGEVHPNPEEALSDGAQSLFPDQFSQLMREVRIIAEAKVDGWRSRQR